MLTKTTDGAGTGNFSSSIIGLYGGATFYIRAYATNDAGTAYGNEVALTIPITIGQGLGGGMVFYLDGTGLHGLIASYFDESVSTWYNGSNIVTNATSITDGSLNTTTIISAQGNTGVYAAKLCKDYRLGGYSDWFLPSKDQLNKLYLQKSLLGNLVNNIYWSSTEIDNTQVWGQNFLNGTQAAASKNAMSYVRPIRSF